MSFQSKFGHKKRNYGDLKFGHLISNFVLICFAEI